MNILKKIGQQTDDIQEDQDSLGGNLRESGLVELTIQAAYIDVSDKGSYSFNLICKDNTDKEYRETLWITNKKGENFYEYNGEKRYLPGFNVANAISLLTTGYSLSDLDDPEEKKVEVWDFDEGKMVLKDKDCITQLNGEAILVGILKEIVDKTKLNESTGQYVPTGETRTVNVIDKVFHAESRMTVAEIRDDAEEAVFVDKWAQKWTGKERNRAKGAKNSGNTGVVGAPQKAKTSLFGKK